MEEKIEILDKFIGKTLAGKYRIDEEWRESGLGKVYRGIHLLMDKPVAVKILSPALAVDINIVNRFSAEARLVSSVAHPNILSVTDFGTDDDGTVFIVFEEADGETVDQTLARDGAFSAEHAVRIARQVASALSTAHARNIFHHHLTGAKILLEHTASGAEVVKVLDLGAVKPEDDGMFAEEIPDGDLEYLAPEQNSSVSEPDERADVYSLGVILYQMLTGEVPFSAETKAELLAKQTDTPPPPFSSFRDDLPEDLEPIVIRALAKNPEMRHPDIGALAEELTKISREFDDTEGVVVPQAAAASAGSSNNRWKTAFVVLAGISLLAVGMIYATYTNRTEPVTKLETDAEGLPVQPLNPATGINEQNLMYTAMDGPLTAADIYPTAGSMPEIVPGGDGYDPWGRGVAPPPGAPVYPTGGEIITIPGTGAGSQFMPNFTSDGQIILIPVPAGTNPTATPTATPQTGNPPANTKPSPSPKTGGETPPETQPTPKTVPSPAKPPANTPEKPANDPASSGKRTDSGKEQDTF